MLSTGIVGTPAAAASTMTAAFVSWMQIQQEKKATIFFAGMSQRFATYSALKNLYTRPH